MVMKIDTMSKNIVRILQALSKNDGLVDLLINDVEDPFNATRPEGFENKDIVKFKSEFCRISPIPFSPQAQVSDMSFIRAYYNTGGLGRDNFDVITESQINIDIIVARNLWLINRNGEPLIRPYEIMDIITDTIGKRSIDPIVKLDFTGFQHLAVNTQFDAIRLYADYYSVEA